MMEKMERDRDVEEKALSLLVLHPGEKREGESGQQEAQRRPRPNGNITSSRHHGQGGYGWRGLAGSRSPAVAGKRFLSPSQRGH